MIGTRRKQTNSRSTSRQGTECNVDIIAAVLCCLDAVLAFVCAMLVGVASVSIHTMNAKLH